MAVALAVEVIVVAVLIAEPGGWRFGMDFAYYRELAERWLADGTFYLPRQLEGPYIEGLLDQASVVDTLYPPLALVLFVPFTFLPAPLWWAIPIGVCAVVIRSFAPAAWAWPVMLACLFWPRSVGSLAFGNTDMWIAACVAAGLRWGWPALLVLVKPSLAPLALIGARNRAWWIGLVALVAFVVLSWQLWADYLQAMVNAGIPLTYSLHSVPLVAVALVAWLARRDRVGMRPPARGQLETRSAESDPMPARETSHESR